MAHTVKGTNGTRYPRVLYSLVVRSLAFYIHVLAMGIDRARLSVIYIHVKFVPIHVCVLDTSILGNSYV